MENIEKIIEKEEEKEQASCSCPNSDICEMIYGCPKNYEDCLEYTPKNAISS